MTRELTCIGCPMGCQISVDLQYGTVVSVTGNECPRGDRYARQECIAPERMVTSLMIADFTHAPVSVKTLKPIPKGKIQDCLREIRNTHPGLPIRSGDILITDVAGTGVPVVATKDLL